MSQTTFRPGQLCDKYRIVRLLNHDELAEVYHATQEFIERDVALKTLSRRYAKSDFLRRQLYAEARVLGQVRHPNLVPIYDAGVAACGATYAVTELLRGRSLRKELTTRRVLELDRALEIAGAAADAMAAAHAAGVVHGELSPENVFIVGPHAFKVLALGTARRSSCERAEYAAPEQRDQRRIDERTDIYALGVMLCEMVCGAHGYRELLARRARRPETLAGVAELPISVSQLIVRAAARCASERPATMSEFASEIRGARRALRGPGRAPPAPWARLLR